ncbi:MAG TPA: hypothetical protein VFJ52_01105 [Terriglobia bacterium]|nr:hypothetical protein [Terriglobia bacterium]
MSNPGQAASYATAARIGRWIIPAIPFGWNWVPGFGIQHAAQGMVPSNVCLKEDVLLAGDQLALYIQAQITIMKRTFLEPVVAGPAPLEYPGATEAALLMLKHQPMNQTRVFQVQHYIRMDRWIGIITLTTVESELLKVRPDFDQFVKLLKIGPEEAPLEGASEGVCEG